MAHLVVPFWMMIVVAYRNKRIDFRNIMIGFSVHEFLQTFLLAKDAMCQRRILVHYEAQLPDHGN